MIGSSIAKKIFSTKLVGWALIPAGSSGAGTSLVTLTPPSGQRVILTHLSTKPAQTESNMGVTVGGVDVTGSISVKGDLPSGASISVGSYLPYTAGIPPSNNHRQIYGGTDEVVVIRKTGVTVNDLYYSYIIGE